MRARSPLLVSPTVLPCSLPASFFPPLSPSLPLLLLLLSHIAHRARAGTCAWSTQHTRGECIAAHRQGTTIRSWTSTRHSWAGQGHLEERGDILEKRAATRAQKQVRRTVRGPTLTVCRFGTASSARGRCSTYRATHGTMFAPSPSRSPPHFGGAASATCRLLRTRRKRVLAPVL